jgi:dolichol-phosphate mannosyltransferase
VSEPRRDTTIIVPTFNEGANITALVERLATAFRGRDAEVLFVDDSTDDTPRQIERAARSTDIPIRWIHRDKRDQVGGLAGAVATGLRASTSEYVLVMDGDLQHPPEMAPELRDAVDGVDLSVASRHAPSGDASGLSSRYRRWVSGVSTMLAKACFPRRVGQTCTDPMTGFFCFRRSAVDLRRLRPRGFKILLEILARHDLRVRELPFTFGNRLAGESKASWRNGLHFVHQLLSLRMGRMSRFAATGVLGTVVNLLVMAGLTAWTPLNYVFAAVIAAEISILHNFMLQERFVFPDLRKGTKPWRCRLGQHLAFNNVEALIRLPFLVLLVETAHIWAVLAQAVTLVIAFVVRFLFMSRVVYRPERSTTDVRSQALQRQPPRSLLTRSTANGLVARMLIALAATAVAFPDMARALSRVHGPVSTALLALVVAAAVALGVARTRPTPGDPDVHDRQLDVIAGLPVLGATVWLSAGGSLTTSERLEARDVVAATAFLYGTCFLLLGTRVVMRLWWVLLLPLLALPAITERRPLAVLLTGVVVLAAAAMLGRTARRGRAREPGPDRTRRLPRLAPAGALTVVLACALGASALPITTTAAGWWLR